MAKKICLLSDHHISYNPRLWKEAFTWEKLGYEVVILNMWISEGALEKDRNLLHGHNIRYECYLNLVPGQISPPAHFYYRVRKRIFTEIQKWFKVGFKWSLSYAPEKMIRRAIAEKADYYSAHLECAFYAGRRLIKRGRKVFYDFEDWYSRDYLVPERPVALLRKLENFALNMGVFCMTTSRSMASALATAYHVNKELQVIYNGFSIAENAPHNYMKVKPAGVWRFIWFSRTVGPNRGIEKFLNVLIHFKTPVELHLLGETTAEYQQSLSATFPAGTGHSLHFHDFLPHHQLVPFLANFHLGLAIEENVNDNKDLTISNKILQYLQAGIKVLATKTAGQMEVQKLFPEQVKILDMQNAIADTTNEIEQWLALSEIDMNESLKKFNSIFSQEAQEKKLMQLAAIYLK